MLSVTEKILHSNVANVSHVALGIFLCVSTMNILSQGRATFTKPRLLTDLASFKIYIALGLEPKN